MSVSDESLERLRVQARAAMDAAQRAQATARVRAQEEVQPLTDRVSDLRRQLEEAQIALTRAEVAAYQRLCGELGVPTLDALAKTAQAAFLDERVCQHRWALRRAHRAYQLAHFEEWLAPAARRRARLAAAWRQRTAELEHLGLL